MERMLRIATRRSELALWQANHVRSLLLARYPQLQVELVPMVTQGDRILDRPLAALGGKGLFLKELELALRDGAADLAVHSMKDVPAEPTPGLPVDVVLERGNPHDALLSGSGAGLRALPAGARVGTGSLRRQCQLRSLRPDLEVLDLRGNVNTRVARLQEGRFDAIILACAGLERLGLGRLVSETLAAPGWLPAVAQGTIGIQCREQDAALRELLRALDHPMTALRTRAERAVALDLHGSCHLPLAVFASATGGELAIDALLGQPDGSEVLRSSRRGPAGEADRLAAEVAADLRRQGAERIIAGLAAG